MKPLVRLYDSIGTGIIVAWPTGVIFSNQTGGTWCLQPELEGIFVPVANDYLLPDGPIQSPELDLRRHFKGLDGAIRGITAASAGFIDELFANHGLTTFTVDRTRLRDSHEAWIHILISKDGSLIAGFAPYPRRAVLTWGNSD